MYIDKDNTAPHETYFMSCCYCCDQPRPSAIMLMAFHQIKKNSFGPETFFNGSIVLVFYSLSVKANLLIQKFT